MQGKKKRTGKSTKIKHKEKNTVNIDLLHLGTTKTIKKDKKKREVTKKLSF